MEGGKKIVGFIVTAGVLVALGVFIMKQQPQWVEGIVTAVRSKMGF